jgi:phytoene dehydrogenase-like protein
MLTFLSPVSQLFAFPTQTPVSIVCVRNALSAFPVRTSAYLSGKPTGCHGSSIPRASVSEGPAEARGSATIDNEEWDVIIVGSGFGGLSCAAVATALGFKTLVLESHYAAGGVAHGFDVKNEAGTFHFDTGPSFFCGLSKKGSLNPVKMVLDALGESVPCVPYDRFCIDDLLVGTVHVCADESDTLLSVEAIAPGGSAELKRFNDVMRSMHAGMDVPAIALRGDALVLPMIFRRWPGSMLKLLPYIWDVKRPVSDILDRVDVRDPFVRRLVDVEAFLLSGLKASSTITAEIAFMVGERSQSNAIEYPIGGVRLSSFSHSLDSLTMSNT